jgi:hypothetical protein
MRLSDPAIEGLSGAPVLSWTSASDATGATVAGICFSSESLRALASEVVELEDDSARYRETINRIVEFGLAYRADTVQAFLAERGVAGALP